VSDLWRRQVSGDLWVAVEDSHNIMLEATSADGSQVLSRKLVTDVARLADALYQARGFVVGTEAEPAVVKATRETDLTAPRPLFRLEMTGNHRRGLGRDYEYKHLTLPRAVTIAGSVLGNTAIARELVNTALAQGWARASVGGSQSAMLSREDAQA